MARAQLRPLSSWHNSALYVPGSTYYPAGDFSPQRPHPQDPNREVRNEYADQDAGHRRPDQGRAAVAARLHDGIERGRRRLHARGRPGARRRRQDRHHRPHGGRRQGGGRGRRDAGVLRPAGRRRQPAGDPGRHGDLRPSRVHPRRHPKARQARRARGRTRLLLPQGRPHQSHRDAAAVPDRERQDRCRAVRRSRRHRRVGEVPGRQHRPARHHGLLPRRPHRVALFDPRQPQGRRSPTMAASATRRATASLRSNRPRT